MSDKPNGRVYTMRPGFHVHLVADNGPVPEKKPVYSNDRNVGKDTDGIPQPYVGAIVFLQHIAEFGLIPFFENGESTPNRETARRMAQELIDAQRKLWDSPVEHEVAQDPISGEMEIMPQSLGGLHAELLGMNDRVSLDAARTIRNLRRQVNELEMKVDEQQALLEKPK